MGATRLRNHCLPSSPMVPEISMFFNSVGVIFVTDFVSMAQVHKDCLIKNAGNLRPSLLLASPQLCAFSCKNSPTCLSQPGSQEQEPERGKRWKRQQQHLQKLSRLKLSLSAKLQNAHVDLYQFKILCVCELPQHSGNGFFKAQVPPWCRCERGRICPGPCWMLLLMTCKPEAGVCR